MSRWLTSQLEVIAREIHDMDLTCRRAMAASRSQNEEEANGLMEHLAARSEHTTLSVRNVVRYTPRQRPQDAHRGVFNRDPSWGISRTESGWYRVVCPRLMPSKSSGNVRWLRETLYPVLDDFFRNGNYPKLDPAVLIVRTIYPADTPERWMTDHDNMEFSEVTDLVALYTMATDNPAHCSNYYCSARSDANEERTEIYVVPQADFPAWICKFMPLKSN